MTDDEIEQLIYETRSLAREVARRYFSEPDRREEMVQMFCLRLWTKRAEVDAQQNPRSYALYMAHSVCMAAKQLDARRHKAGWQEGGYEGLSEGDMQGDNELSDASPTHPLARGDEFSALRDLDVRRAMEALPGHLWIIAWLVHGEGYSISEAGRRLGLARPVAATRLEEATQWLQQRLKWWLSCLV